MSRSEKKVSECNKAAEAHSVFTFVNCDTMYTGIHEIYET